MIQAMKSQAKTTSALAVLALTCATFTSPSQAGAVSTSFDPLFGSALPDLSYSGSVSFNIADNCLGPSSAGLRHISLGSGCKTTASATLRLFDADVAGDSVNTTFGIKVNGLTLLNDLVVGWDTNAEVFSNSALTNLTAKLLGANVYGSNPYKAVAAAKNNDFSFRYSNGVPQLTCLYCNGKAFDFILGGYEGGPGQPGFTQNISYTNDGGTTTAIVMTLNGATPQYSLAVPEPTSVSLLLAGMLALLGSTRRARQRQAQ